MPKIEFVGESIQDESNIAANPSRLVNMYRTPVYSEGRTRFVMRSVLGQTQTADTGTLPIRAMGRGNDKSWVIASGQLWELDDTGQVTTATAIDEADDTLIDGNYTDTTITVADKYYVWSAVGVLSQPTTLAFGTVGLHCYVGGYTVISEKDGKRFQASDLANAQSLQADHVWQADRRDDNILRVVELNGDLVVMGTNSTEHWQLTGNGGDRAFGYVRTSETGLKGFHLLAKPPNALIFVGHDNRVYDYMVAPISTLGGGVENALKNNSPTHCFYFEDGGSKMVVVRFSDRPSWCYDLSTKEWHERAENAAQVRWRGTHSIESFRSATGDVWRVGNTDGQILELARTNRDINGVLRREVTSRAVEDADIAIDVFRVEMLARMGDHTLDEVADLALDAGDGNALRAEAADKALDAGQLTGGERDGIIHMFESSDGGRTYGPDEPRSLGLSGDYDKRMVWSGRGQHESYTVKFVIDEPADITLYADGEMEVG